MSKSTIIVYSLKLLLVYFVFIIFCYVRWLLLYPNMFHAIELLQSVSPLLICAESWQTSVLQVYEDFISGQLIELVVFLQVLVLTGLP